METIKKESEKTDAEQRCLVVVVVANEREIIENEW